MLSFGKFNNQFVAVFDAIDSAKLSDNLAWLRRKGCVFVTHPNGYHTAYSRFMKYSSSKWQTSFAGVQD